ncbi:MAG: DUF6252 family protein [Gilvibacter sp.]
MIRIALLCLLTFSFMACEDLQDNTSIMQGSANDELFKAGAVATQFADGTVSISANTELENLTLKLTNVQVGTYAFGPGSANLAEFTDLDGRTFSTGTVLGDGAAMISEYNTATNTITGSFIFNAHTFALLDTLNFQRGVIFQVPVIGGEDTTVGPTLGQGITATIDGVTFEAVSVEGFNVTGFIDITGVEETRIINIRFANNLPPGEYDLASGDFTATYSIDGTATAATSGAMRIDTHNTGTGEITGSFSFSGDGFEVIDGSFVIIY